MSRQAVTATAGRIAETGGDLPEGLPARAGAVLSLVGLHEARIARAGVVALRRLLLAIVCVELWDASAAWEGDPNEGRYAMLAIVASIAAAAAWRPRWARLATWAAAFALAVDFTWNFPGNANHQYLEVVAMSLLLILREEVDEEAVLLAAILKWLVVLGLFYAGMQKLLYGYYFEGLFLAFTVPQSPRFAAVLAPLMPAAELERLLAIRFADGAGPFRVDSLVFVIASNLSYAIELLLPLALLVPRLRKLAVIGVILYFVAIEVAAREVFFGGLMVGLALLFWPGALARVLPLMGLALAYLLAIIFGLLPGWAFT